MRPFSPLAFLLLLVPAAAHAEPPATAPAAAASPTPPATTARAALPATPQAAPPATPPQAALPVTPPQTSPNIGVAAAIELLSPLGGAGCFYEHRYLTGALVVAGAAISGGTLIYGLANDDRDAIILNAVAYGVSRLIGIVAVVRPDEPPPPPPPPSDTAPRAAMLPLPPRATIGLSYAFSF